MCRTSELDRLQSAFFLKTPFYSSCAPARAADKKI